MKILIAPDSFKESLSAFDVASAIETGLRKAIPQIEVVKIPIADGGEGLVEAMVSAAGGEVVPCEVTGPLGKPVQAFYGLLNKGETAVIEMAAAAGLDLISVDERDPLKATTRGVGELMIAVLDQGVKHIIMGLGGSATNDCGAGMLRALGVHFLDCNRDEVAEGGSALGKVKFIDVSKLDDRLAGVSIEVACDVDNPLIGPKGATYVFGPQKGVIESDLAHLEACLSNFGSVMERVSGKVLCSAPGAGAAGGMGAACIGVLNAELKPGIEIVLETLKVAKHIPGCDLVITGEGRMDSQSAHGKAPVGVARLAKKHDVPVFAVVGSLGQGFEAVYDSGIDAVFSIVPGIVSLQEAMRDAEKNLNNTAYNIARTIQCVNTSGVKL